MKFGSKNSKNLHNQTVMERSRGVYKIQWNDKRTKQAYKLALLGATDKEMAEIMDVDLMTFDYWKRTKPEFRNALRAAKRMPNAQTAMSLYKCANGYYYKDQVAHVVGGGVVKTWLKKYQGPNAWAANKILSVRERAIWADSAKLEITNTQININKFDFSGITKEEMRFIASIGMKQLREHVGDDNQN